MNRYETCICGQFNFFIRKVAFRTYQNHDILTTSGNCGYGLTLQLARQQDINRFPVLPDYELRELCRLVQSAEMFSPTVYGRNINPSSLFF
jgi:hypothetical protein